ncbi:MAG: glycosyltransferase, partial [Nitrospirota bacterium]|nr:glycosyltransferase [Nitrospirota bacterium]
MDTLTNNPLVSIIVRTKDRPELLKRALQSIAPQTYRPIEVVLVNDGGCDLDVDEIKDILGDVLLNYIRLEKNTGRAHAGNVGIENANGEYIGFLDDDDELYPEHVLTLISFLEQSDYKVAYTDTKMVVRDFAAEEKQVIDVNETIFSRDFSYKELLIGNYIPFNSICFPKKILSSAGWLDESLDLYEDWDFLIRIGQEYPFYHIKKVTAQYNQWSRNLQINQADTEYMKAMHLKIIGKHHEKITPEIILEMKHERERVELELNAFKDRYNALKAELSKTLVSSEEKDMHIFQLQETIKEKDVVSIEKVHLAFQLEGILSERDSRIAQMENAINSIHETLGWKLLERFRRFREKILPLGTGRRKIYDLSVKSIKYIQREGFRRFKNRVFHRYNIPVSFNRNNYEIWISKNEPDYAALKKQVKLSKEFKLNPKISIITPVYNPGGKVFIEMIESVFNQTYDNWELCLANASTEPYIKDIIERYKKTNGNKIKVKHLEQNYGIAKNSNEALSLATGDFVALLDHDDILPPFALYEVVGAVNNNPEADFLCSDEDKISEDGKTRSEPHFKPDWSPDLLRSHNYITHLSVFKKQLIEKIGSFREGFDGSQDYDLILRATEQAKRIIHIPKILYHWRISPNSAAGNVTAKVYAFKSAKRALREHLIRIGLEGKVEDTKLLGFYRVTYNIKDNPKVSIIIPNKDQVFVLRNCINSILKKTTYKNYEIIIVENSSSERQTFEYYKELSEIRNISIIHWDNQFNFSAVNNFGAKHATGEILLFLNNDTEVLNNDWMERMLEHGVRKEVGAVGAKLCYPNETIQHAGVVIGMGGIAGHPHLYYPKDAPGYMGKLQVIRNLSAVTGACLMTRKEIFDGVNGFDEGYPLAFNDVDLCLKILEKGY